MENRKKVRYLLIYCGGSGYPDEITEFFKNTYKEKRDWYDMIYGREYYDVVAELGSIYSLLIIRDKAPKGLSSFFDTLAYKIQFYISEHNLDRIVVVGEPDCAWYKKLSGMEGTIPRFETQKDAFMAAIRTLKTIVPSNHIKFIYGWYIGEELSLKYPYEKNVYFENIYNFDVENEIEVH